MKKHFEFLKKKVFFQLLFLYPSSSSLNRLNQSHATLHHLMIMMKIFPHLSVSLTKSTILQLVLLSNLLKSFQMDTKNPTHKLKRFSTGKQKMPDPKIES
ncbi:hypothetical protein ACOSP7_014525 [Xanthoceras sorbifolium]